MHAPRRFTDLAVDLQTPGGVELQRADAEGRLVSVDLDAVTVAHHDPARVERRRVDAPALRVAHDEPLPERRRLTREARERRDLGRDDRAAVVDDLGLHRRGRRHRAVVLEHRVHLDDRDLVVELGRRHEQTVERQVHQFTGHQLHVSVDPCTGVPASVLLRDHLDPDLVVVAVTDEMVDRQREAGVAVRVVSGEAAVHPHRRVAVHAFELDEHPLAARVGRNREVLLVLPRAVREVRVSRTLRRAAGRTDHRVVRQPHRRPRRHLPAALEERADLGAEAPAVVERRALHGASPSVSDDVTASRRTSVFSMLVIMYWRGVP